MSFIGIVTRKEETTGVDLEAKIVTGNKKKSARKRFPVRVKENAIDDYTRCMIDNATAKNKILAMNDTSAVIADLTPSMMYSGENDTKTSYKVQNQGVPLLSEFLSDNGTVLGRPKLGKADATGTLEITTKRGDAVVISRIPITIKQITELEVLNHEKLSAANLWNTYVRGGNGAFSNSQSSGTKNIKSKLNLIRNVLLNDVADVPVNIEWTITDNTLIYNGGIYTEPRIDAEGKIERPTYTDACTMYASMPTYMTFLREGGASSGRNISYRIGGITLEATLTLNSYEAKVTYDCATLSKYLTNKEVMNKVAGSGANTASALISILTPDYDKVIKYIDNATLILPDSLTEYKLRTYHTGVKLSIPEYGLTGAEGVGGVDIDSYIKAYNGTDAYVPATEVFGGDFQLDDDVNYEFVNININELKAQDPQWMKFSCVSVVKVSGYSSDGLSTSGANEEVTRTAKIAITLQS